MTKIAIVGLGYVGLPLALLADEKDYDVIGLDVDQNRIAQLKKGVSPLNESAVENKLQTSSVTFTSDYKKLGTADIAIVCVPTPVRENKQPDLRIVKDASVEAARHLKDDALLIIESTINPGVCDEVLIPAIESETDKKVGTTLLLAHCPERINPGDPKWHIGNINRVLGAHDDSALKKAYTFYANILDADIKKMQSIKEAEAVKIVENSFRDINIAFVNELAMSFEKLGINPVNVINGAATKPFAFIPHYPGIGVGGHCIPVDPYYLIEYARGNGFEHHFLSLARNINENMPVYAIDKLEQQLIRAAVGPVKGKSIAILGLSYKADVNDDRESPAYAVIDELKKRGAKPRTFDPHILERSSSKTLKDVLDQADAAILVTPHKEFTLKNILASDIRVFLDGRNTFTGDQESFVKNNIDYIGI